MSVTTIDNLDVNEPELEPVEDASDAADPGPTAWQVRRHHAATVAWSIGQIVFISVTILFFASLITFFLRAASGITPVSLMARGDEGLDPVLEAKILEEWGLNRPIWEQYFSWVSNALHGDLGRSWTNSQEVSNLLMEKLPVSMSVAVFAIIIGVVFGGLLGILAAVKQGSWIDRAITATSSIFTAVPAFVVGIVLIIVFSVNLGWFPAGGYVTPQQDFWGWLTRITLPAVALSLDPIADIARQLRNGLIGAQQGNYATGAVLRGFSRRRVLFGHVLRNGAGPTLTVLGMKFPFLLGGSILIEEIFALPGYGVFSTSAASYGDVPVVQGALIVSVVLVLLFNLGVNALLNRLTPAGKRGI